MTRKTITDRPRKLSHAWRLTFMRPPAPRRRAAVYTRCFGAPSVDQPKRRGRRDGGTRRNPHLNTGKPEGAETWLRGARGKHRPAGLDRPGCDRWSRIVDGERRP